MRVNEERYTPYSLRPHERSRLSNNECREVSRCHSSDEISVMEVERRAKQLTEVYLLHLCL